MILPPFFAIHPSVLDTARVLRVANLLTSALCQEYYWNDRARSRDAHHTIGIASSEKEDALIVAANRARTVFYAICLRNSDFLGRRDHQARGRGSRRSERSGCQPRECRCLARALRGCSPEGQSQAGRHQGQLPRAVRDGGEGRLAKLRSWEPSEGSAQQPLCQSLANGSVGAIDSISGTTVIGAFEPSRSGGRMRTDAPNRSSGKTRVVMGKRALKGSAFSAFATCHPIDTATPVGEKMLLPHD